jgi:predicted neuraminidase
MNPLELGKGHLTSFFRSRWADAIYQSESQDAGKTWSEPWATSLPNNNSSIQAIKLKDSRIALVYNHSSVVNATGRRTSLYDDLEDNKTLTVTTGERQAFWGAPRAPLSLVFSSDGGKTWGERLDLEVGDGFCLSNNSTEHVNRELSYPSICEAPDGSLDIAFTYFRQVIKHVRLKL